MSSALVSHTVEELKKLTTEELVALFKSLPSPSITEMDGEFAACLLQQPSSLSRLFGHISVANPLMPWLCKAFRPVDAESGRGYNTFSLLGKVVQRFPMQTVIAPSRYDGNPAYTLVYHLYHSMCGDIHMVDEVRKVADGVYLGIGTWGFTRAQRQIPLPFLLEGPIGVYRKDIGRKRSGAVLAREIPALNR
ncbi:hypothetical protein [Aquirhabdus parva]|uniref:Uncharacterized protein n=1 Tax=Aquirhabdus parva TaxID=2283318 RepID=A0A345P8Q8_9GAMM|nr:hypothetical protein [Aquirhabdus parva]AXI03667.1 hypothetical protein HYN46_13015 [Aquirhabdus parva]